LRRDWRMTVSKRELDERASSYSETVLHFPGEPPVTIDLRVEVTDSLKTSLAALGLGGEFAVITAFNPRGEIISDEENRRRMSKLEAELVTSGRSFVRLDACSPDKSHCECSVAVEIPRDDAIGIAKRWEQLAIFWFDGGSSWIISAISDAHPIKLPVS
jgi:hypothetical protein